jgi:hypothetical protein
MGWPTETRSGTWRYGDCSLHAVWKTKRAAKRAVLMHKQEYPECRKCNKGYVLRAFSCPLEVHWHTGHSRPREELSA